MDFLKKHYEKVLLGVVLLGLAVAVAFLPFKIASEKQKLEDMRNQLIHPKVKELTNLDLSLPDAVLKRMAAPALVDFSAPTNSSIRCRGRKRRTVNIYTVINT